MRWLPLVACFLIATVSALSGCGSGCKQIPPIHFDTEPPQPTLSAPKNELRIGGEMISIRGPAVKQAAGSAKLESAVAQIVGYQIDYGWFEGECISDTRMAYVLVDGAIEIYIDAPEPTRHAALRRLAKWSVKERGSIARIRDAKIELKLQKEQPVLRVDDVVRIECVLGKGKTSEHRSIAGDNLVPEFLHGSETCTSGMFLHDGSLWTLEPGSPAQCEWWFNASHRLDR